MEEGRIGERREDGFECVAAWLLRFKEEGVFRHAVGYLKLLKVFQVEL